MKTQLEMSDKLSLSRRYDKLKLIGHQLPGICLTSALLVGYTVAAIHVPNLEHKHG